jgi:hypothetical protein
MTGVSRYLTAKSAVEQMGRAEKTHDSLLATAESNRGIKEGELAIKKAEHEAEVKLNADTQVLLNQLAGGGGSGGGPLANQPGAPMTAKSNAALLSPPAPTMYGFSEPSGPLPGTPGSPSAPGQRGGANIDPQRQEQLLARLNAINPDVGEKVSKQMKDRADREKVQKENTAEAFTQQAKSIRDGGMAEEDEMEYLNTLFASGVQNGVLKPEDADRLSDSYQQGGREAFWKAASPYMDGEDGAKDASPVFANYTRVSDGQVVLMNKNNPRDEAELSIPGKYILAASKSEVKTGSPNDWNKASATQASKLLDYRSSTMNYISRGNAILKNLHENPHSNDLLGLLGRMGTNFIQDATSLAGLSGESSWKADFSEDDPYDATGTIKLLKELGIPEGIMQSQIQALAYMQAKMNDRGGRVTDADFKTALRILGANNSDPDIFAGVLREQMMEGAKAYRMDHQNREDQPGIAPYDDPHGNFDIWQDPDAAPVRDYEAEWVAGGSRVLTPGKEQAEYDDLAKGELFKHPDGRILVKD